MVPEADRAEHAALSDAFRASPEVVTIAEIGGATCFAIPRLAHRFFNRVIGLDSIEPVDEIAEFYGELPWWVYDVNGLGPALAERGFTDDYGFMKFSRGIGPREAHSELRVDQVGEDRAADFARVVVGGFELPEWTEPVAANVVGRPGWSCYVAYDGDEPAGAGALHADGGVGWLGFGATLPDVPGARRPERDSRRPHRGRAPAGLSDGGHRDRRARRRPPVELVPQHPPGRLPRGRCPAELPRPLGLTLRRPRYAGAMRVRGVSLALLVVAVVAAWAAQTAAARTPLQIGSVVPELLDPALQQSTVTLMDSAGLGDTARVTVTWERSQTTIDPGLLVGPRERYRRRAGRRERRLPRRLSDRQLADAEDDRRADAIRELARRRRQGAPGSEARDRRQRAKPEPVLVAAVRSGGPGRSRGRLRAPTRQHVRRCQARGAPGRGRRRNTRPLGHEQARHRPRHALARPVHPRHGHGVPRLAPDEADHGRLLLPPVHGALRPASDLPAQSARQHRDDRGLRETDLAAPACVRRDEAEGADPAARLRRVRSRGEDPAGARVALHRDASRRPRIPSARRRRPGTTPTASTSPRASRRCER